MHDAAFVAEMCTHVPIQRFNPLSQWCIHSVFIFRPQHEIGVTDPKCREPTSPVDSPHTIHVPEMQKRLPWDFTLMLSCFIAIKWWTVPRIVIDDSLIHILILTHILINKDHWAGGSNIINVRRLWDRLIFIPLFFNTAIHFGKIISSFWNGPLYTIF